MTVLQSIDRYYGRMAARGEASLPGYSSARIGFVVILAPDGAPVSVIDLRRADGRRMVAPAMDIPKEVKRSSNPKPNLLWDKTAYSLGRTAGAGHRTADEHARFKAENLAFIGDSQDIGLVAYRRFLESWSPVAFDAAPFFADMLDANIVFALAGYPEYLHQSAAVRRLLDMGEGSDATARMCLVTGIEAPIARLHPSIKGVQDAHTAGASIVSFNQDSFTSYGKLKGENAPVSEAATARYSSALNSMLARDSRNRLRHTIGDATLVFWADTSDTVDEAAAAMAEQIFGITLDPPKDAAEAVQIGDALRKLADGQKLSELGLGLATGTRFHVLGLSPNVARLSIRYWLDNDFAVFATSLARHHQDIALDPPPWRDTPPSVSRLLVKTTAVQEKVENIPPMLAGEVMRALLGGTPYPRTWLVASIMRLRAGDDPRTGWHAAAIKACLARISPQEVPPVSLDPDQPSPAYQLGRLFAVLEAAQYAALGRVNASIADRYYGAASSTPARVFGTLLRGARTHISDAQKRNLGFWITPRLEQIIGRLPAELPRTLRLEDQGRFAIGYYHERAYRPAKSTAQDATMPSPSTEQDAK